MRSLFNFCFFLVQYGWIILYSFSTFLNIGCLHLRRSKWVLWSAFSIVWVSGKSSVCVFVCVCSRVSSEGHGGEVHWQICCLCWRLWILISFLKLCQSNSWEHESNDLGLFINSVIFLSLFLVNLKPIFLSWSLIHLLISSLSLLLKLFCGPAVQALQGSLLEMQNLRSHPRVPGSESALN